MIDIQAIRYLVSADLALLAIFSALDVKYVDLPPVSLAILLAPLVPWIILLRSSLLGILLIVAFSIVAVIASYKMMGYLDAPIIVRIGISLFLVALLGPIGFVAFIAGFGLAALYIFAFLLYIQRDTAECGNTLSMIFNDIIYVPKDKYMKPYYFPPEVKKLGMEALSKEEMEIAKKKRLSSGKECIEAIAGIPAMPVVALVVMAVYIAFLLVF
ncbi:MAG: hypothetical protein GXO26_07720 [Crenarchaeota archaeon]|nr:hypothetical protein [Thermoproteota archaeon]